MWQITIKTINSFFQNSPSKIKLNFKSQSNHQNTWKRSNTIPVHKKNEKQLVKIYRPISLSLIFGKTFEKIIFNKIYNFLLEEKLLNPNQSGFCPSDSCMNQPLGITHEIPQALTGNPPLEIWSLSLDISKALDKVWRHEELLNKYPVQIPWWDASLQTPSLYYILGQIFTWSNSTILVEDLMRWKINFEVFLFDHYASDIGYKKIAVT